MHWTTKYMASCYADHGRTLPELDCWGMGRAIQSERAGIDLPAFGRIHPDDKLAMTSAMSSLLSQFEPCQPQELAIACVMRGDVLLHVGTVVELDGRLQVLHTRRQTGPIIEPLRRFHAKYGSDNVRFYGYRKDLSKQTE